MRRIQSRDALRSHLGQEENSEEEEERPVISAPGCRHTIPGSLVSANA
jgi:hypothetical protein